CHHQRSPRANSKTEISREAGRIDARNSFPMPVTWLRRLDSALRLKEFVGRKDFSRDLIGLEYEVDPNNPDESDDGQLGFIHIAFDRMVTTPKPSSHLILYLGMLYLKLTAKNLTMRGQTRLGK
ncbi:hypothetical protein FOFC_18022, partial [Fusarium oxysporum]